MLTDARQRIPPPPSRSRYASGDPRGSRCPIRAIRWASKVATREAYGTALAALGSVDPRVVALDADVGNSTFSQKFERGPRRIGSTRPSSLSR